MALLPDLLLVVSGGLAISISYLAARNRPRDGSMTLASLMALIGLWSFFHLTEHHATGIAELGFAKMKFALLAPTAFVWFAFALVFTGKRRFLTRRTGALLLGWPASIAVFVWIPESIQSPLAIWGQLQAEQGLVYWVHVGLSFGLLAAGSALVIVHVLSETGLFRRQGLAILSAVIAAWAGALIAVFELLGDLHLHSLPIGMVVMGGFLLWGIRGVGLTRISPIAQREIMQTMNAGVVAMDDELRVTSINPAAEALLDVGEEAISGASVTVVFGDVPELVDWIETSNPVKATSTESFEIDDKIFQCHLSPLRDRRDRVVGWVLLINDMTQQRAQQRELERQKERLEQFSEMVAHDLRNPLSVAKGRIELEAQETESENLEIAGDALDRMNALIDEWRTLARSGRQIEDIEVVPLADICNDCWRVIESPEAKIRIETEAEIEAAPGRLRHVFENLFSNAIDHGGPDVTVRVDSLDDGFYVADDGPGLSSGESDVVFEAGYSKHSDGTGLGLAIVSEVVEAHDWEISVTESSMGGARFEITGVNVL